MDASDSLNPTQLTRLLEQSENDAEVLDRVYQLVYRDLHALARGRVQPSTSATLSATALVHEAFLRLQRRTAGAWNGRAHFFRLAARAMRQISVDHARARLTRKRGGGAARQPLNEDLMGGERRSKLVLALQEGLEQLRRTRPQLVQIVECRFFGGYTEEQTAEAMGLSLRSVQRDWKAAREWLKEYLSD